MAAILVSVGPIILIYPFLQKYFIKGVLIGSIKGLTPPAGPPCGRGDSGGEAW